MTSFIDTSVLVAAIVETEPFHEESAALLDHAKPGLYMHGISETFNTLTGGRLSFRMPAGIASEVIEADYVPYLALTTLTAAEVLRALREAQTRGVRGGAVFDYMHLVAARKAKAARLYTLNLNNFLAFYRPGDPQIIHP